MALKQRHYCTTCQETSLNDYEDWEVCKCGGHYDMSDDIHCCQGCKICPECYVSVPKDQHETKWNEERSLCNECAAAPDESTSNDPS